MKGSLVPPPAPFQYESKGEIQIQNVALEAQGPTLVALYIHLGRWDRENTDVVCCSYLRNRTKIPGLLFQHRFQKTPPTQINFPAWKGFSIFNLEKIREGVLITLIRR